MNCLIINQFKRAGQFFILSLLFFIQPLIAEAETVTIAVSANLRETFEELKISFEEKTEHTIKTVVGSSGILTAQIRKGAPYDIFLAANMSYPDMLYRNGITTNKPILYALGSLALWKKASIQGNKVGLHSLINTKITRVAIANPRFAPYGIEAFKALEKSGTLDVLKKKIVYGNSVSQVNGYIFTGSVDVAITAKSSAMSPALKNKGVWSEIDRSLYDPIQQGALLLKKTLASQAFMDFLLSSEGTAILKNHGYDTP